MNDKQHILESVRELSAQGQLTQQELLSAFEQGKTSGVGLYHEEGILRKLSVADVMYYIGGFIVFLGIVILLAQNWDSLSTPIKVLVTFGASVVALLTGILFSRDERTHGLAQPFFMISNLVLPVGIYQVFTAFGYEVNDATGFSLVFALVAAWYLSLYWVLKRLQFLLFGILGATVLYFAVLQAAFISKLTYSDYITDIYEYEVLVIGLCYLFLGYGFSAHQRIKALAGMLYGLGIIAVLGSTFALQGWLPEQNVFWELVYPLLAIGAMFASTYLNRRSFLVFGALGLMAYIIKITSEYFSEGLGWPLALVVCGLAFIGVGYFTFYINKKYFHKSAIPISSPVTPGPTV